MPTTEVLLLAVAMVGTTITPYMQFYLQSAVAEKGIGRSSWATSAPTRYSGRSGPT